jgi:hypothetical protein
VIDDALAAWNANEALNDAVVVDRTGHGWDITLTGTNAVRNAGGRTGMALTKSGATMMALPSGLLTPGQTTARTMMCWVKGTGTTWILRMQVNSINSGSWGLLHVSGNASVQARTAASGAIRAGGTMPADGLWHHYCATYDNVNLRFYLDGVLKQTTALAGPLRTDADVFDAMEWATSTTLIGDPRLYVRDLSLAEVNEAMNEAVQNPGGFFASAA